MKSKKTQRNSIKRRLSKKYLSLKSRGGNLAKESGDDEITTTDDHAELTTTDDHAELTKTDHYEEQVASKKYMKESGLTSRELNQYLKDGLYFPKESGLTSRELNQYLEDGLYFPVLINPRGTPFEKHTAFYKITSFRYGPNNIHLYPNFEQKVPEKLYESDTYDLVDEKSCVKYSSGELKCNDHQKYAVKVVDMNVENETIPILTDVETISDADKKKYNITDRSIKKYQDILTKKIKVLVKTNTWTPIKF